MFVFLIFQYIYFYVHRYSAYMYGHVKVSDPLELEFQSVVSCHVCSGNQTLALFKKGKNSKLQSAFSSPVCFLYLLLIVVGNSLSELFTKHVFKT